jgi:hypothetical protein
MTSSGRDLVERALQEGDLRRLRVLSVCDGLGSNAVRRRAWPLLVGLGSGADSEWQSKNYKVNLHRHADYDQVSARRATIAVALHRRVTPTRDATARDNWPLCCTASYATIRI